MQSIKETTVWTPYFGWCEGQFRELDQGWQAVNVAGISWCSSWGPQPIWADPAMAAEGLLHRAEMEADFALQGLIETAKPAS
jgi:hypothetical protein